MRRSVLLVLACGPQLPSGTSDAGSGDFQRGGAPTPAGELLAAGDHLTQTNPPVDTILVCKIRQ